MKSLRSRHIESKGMFRGFGSAVIVMGTLCILPQMASAEVRTIRMPEDMCDVLREQPLNQRILEQVRDRADFARVLQYVESTCGEFSGLLIGPTGSIAGGPGGDASTPEGDNGFDLPDPGPGDDEGEGEGEGDGDGGEGPGDDEGDGEGEEPTFPDEELDLALTSA
jgi:hypothetical protein